MTTERRGVWQALRVTLSVAALGCIMLATSAVLLGWLLVDELLHDGVRDLDNDVTTWLVAQRTPARDQLSRFGSSLASTPAVLLVVAVFVIVLWARHRWPQIGIIAIAVAVEAITYLVATYFVERHRPQVPRLEHLIVADSFFSGHTAASVALYGSIAVVVWSLTDRRSVRACVVVLAVVMPIVVALSRMYRGMHYASDVTAGALVGLGCIAVALVAVRTGERAYASKVSPAAAEAPTAGIVVPDAREHEAVS